MERSARWCRRAIPRRWRAGSPCLLDQARIGPPRVAHRLDRFSEKTAVDAYLEVLGAGCNRSGP